MSDSNYQAPNSLELANAHPRDRRIGFSEADHVYTITGMAAPPTSVTTVYKKYFEEFDTERVLASIEPKLKQPGYKYYGMTKSQVRNKWRDDAKAAADKGTDLHRSIEIYYNDAHARKVHGPEAVPYPEDKWLKKVRKSKEYGYFLAWARHFAQIHPDYEPFRTEWPVFDEQRGIAGMIDMVFINDKAELIFVDWKRTKCLTDKAFGDRRGKGPFAGWPDANYYHYTAQLNLYRSIVEAKYGYHVAKMYLAVFHPTNETFQFVNVQPIDLSSLRA